jgi:RNA polymerase sigma-70 factor (ECF subfamily)
MQPAGTESRITDPADFTAAFRGHFEAVYRFICRRVGPKLAEDLAADTFATAYRRRASYQPGLGSLRSWLYGIATNVLRNHWRAEQRLLELDAQLTARVGLVANSEAADDRLIASLLAPKLAAALISLTREQHEVLLLYAWAELSHEEIAAALQIAPGTARSRLSRARAALREQLGDVGLDLWISDEPRIGQTRDGSGHA